jgi:DNA helicase-2/ATP-dependent DNA helicase PcrA
MKANEIKIGGRYEAMVSNRLTIVRVDAIRTRDGYGIRRDQTVYDATNLTTGRKVTFASAAKFRKEAPAVKAEAPKLIVPDFSKLGKLDAVEESKEGALFVQENKTVTPRSFATAVSFTAPQAGAASHLLVEARAGTGKTTTLVEGIRLVMGQAARITPSPQQAAVWAEMEKSKGKTPEGICFVAFNKSIASELQSRVPAGCDAMTMHAMGFKAITRTFGYGIKVEGGRVYGIIASLIGRDLKELWKEKANVLTCTEKLVGLCKMNLLSIEDLTSDDLDTLAAHYDVDLNGDRSEVYGLVPQVLARCKEVKTDKMIDFNDMIWLPVVLNLSVKRYSLLLVDEAQDLNRCQQSLAKSAGARLILCGDPRQAIYGFAGADAESMPRMAEELGATPLGCKTLPLTVTRRCGKAIVEEAKKIVADFDAFETNPDGIVRSMAYDPKSENDYSKDVQDGDFVICRVNAPLVSQCFRFLKQGRKANIQGRSIGDGLVKLIKKMKTEEVVALIPKLEEYFRKEEEKENAKKFPSEAKLISLQDRLDCLMFFCEGYTRTEEVVNRIESIFTDDKKSPGIKLSSIHKSKGLEAHRVFFINHKDAPCPHPMAESEWQREQEWNLKYVGITRAINELIWVR